MDLTKKANSSVLLGKKDIKPQSASSSPSLITSEEKDQYFKDKNSYIDYFLEIGANPSLFLEPKLYSFDSIEDINKLIKPEIISKFPNYDKKYLVIDNVTIKTVFPKGFKCIEASSNPDPEFYPLILDNQLTSMEYNHKYIACLIIYESIFNYKLLYNKDKEKNTTEEDKKYYNYYIPKCIALASVFPTMDKFEKILRALYEFVAKEKYNTLLIEELLQKIIINTPRSPRGYKKLYLKLPDNQINLTENKMNELPTIHCNISQTMGHFNVENFVEIFRFFILEAKMIFFSTKLYDLTNTIQSFLTLISPFKYQYQIVSVLPRNLYSFCETISPFIFGINESYTKNFFKKYKIEIEDTTICAVDIDTGEYYIMAPDGKLDLKEYPTLPRHIKEKILHKLNKYIKELINFSSKDVKVKEDNKKYQKMFYNIMLYILRDYPKYLSQDYGVTRTIGMNIQDMIDLNNYINAQPINDRDFYTKIFDSQMFIEFIYKRMMPKDCNDKVEVLYFEEKIFAKAIKKKMFSKSKTSDHNILLTTKDYNYDSSNEIIDLTKIEISPEIQDYLKKNNNFLLYGFYIEDNKIRNCLFPSLINNGDTLFKINKKNYKPGKLLYKEIERINNKVVNKSHLKFEHRKKYKNSEIENDNYLNYLVIFGLTFWYTDKEEREYRFRKMLEILDKIEEHEIEIFEFLFKIIVQFGTAYNVRTLYKKFIGRKLNPSWKIFTLVSKFIKLRSNMYSLNIINNEKDESELKTIKSININKIQKDSFRSRTLKNESDKNILSDDLEFNAYGKCKFCNKIMNLGLLCSNLNTTKFDNDKIQCPNKIKDKSCDKFSEQKLIFRFGVELFNQKIDTYSTSSKKNIKLFSPSTLKKKLLSIVNELQDNNFDVEKFGTNYPDIFWNIIWYFQLNGMETSFMLPYVHTVQTKIIKDPNINFIFNNNCNITDDKKKNIPSIDLNKNNNKNNLIKISTSKKNKSNYNNKDLCIQIIYQFSIIKYLGIISFKNFDVYSDNIGSNEIALLFHVKKKLKPEIKARKEMPKRADSFWDVLFDRISCSVYIGSDEIHRRYNTEKIPNNLLGINEYASEKNTIDLEENVEEVVNKKKNNNDQNNDKNDDKNNDNYIRSETVNQVINEVEEENDNIDDDFKESFIRRGTLNYSILWGENEQNNFEDYEE